MNLYTLDKLGQDKRVGPYNPLQVREQRIRDLWMAAFSVTPTGAGDYFAYIANAFDKDLYVLVESLYNVGAETLSFERSAPGTPATPLTVTPQHYRFGDLGLDSGISVIQGVDLDSAAGLITAAATAKTMKSLRTVANTLQKPGFLFIVPPGNVLQAKAATGTTAIVMNVELWFED